MFPPEPRRGRVLNLALPIIGGMVSQNLLNLVDLHFVGKLGDEANATVGFGSFANFTTLAFVTGLSTGVQAAAARRKGEGRESETAVPLNGGLLLALGFGIALAAIGYAVAPFVFAKVASEPRVAEAGVEFYRIRLLGIPLVGMNFAFRGYWNAINRSSNYMMTLILMHLVNGSLDYLLIFGNFGFPALGVNGAAWANAVANATGTVCYFVMAGREARGAGFLRAVPSFTTLRTMLRTSLPAALQQFLFAAGMLSFFAIVGRLGTAEVAVTNVLVNVLLVAMLPAMGFGLAAASLVGQALGQKDVPVARRWGWDVVRIAVPVVTAIGFVGVAMPDLVLGTFLHDAETLALGRWPLRVIALSLPLDVVGMVLLNALLGAGDSARVLLVSVAMQWLVFLPIAWLVGPVAGLGLTAVWIANAGYRLVQSGIFAAVWRGEAWTRVNV